MIPPALSQRASVIVTEQDERIICPLCGAEYSDDLEVEIDYHRREIRVRGTSTGPWTLIIKDET